MSMIINVARKDFYECVSSLQNITGKKGTIAILNNILIETKAETIVLTATDLEVGIKVEIPAEILSPGSITLPSKKIFEIIRETDTDHIKIEVNENNWAQISTENGVYNIAGTDSEEYPSFPEYESSIMSTVSGEALTDIIEKTIFSVAQDSESQFNLTGALFEKDTIEEKNYLRMISSDGHRLTLMEREIDTDIEKLSLGKTTLIPRKGIQEIKKLADKEEFIEIGFDEKQAIAKTENSILIVRLLNGDFPDYRNIIKAINKDIYVEIGRHSLVSAMKRINLFTEDLYNTVHFQLADNTLTISSQNMDIGSGKEEIETEYSGETLKLGFNGKYFVEALQVMNSERIRAYISSEKSPCLIEAEEDPGFMGIIMPMAI